MFFFNETATTEIYTLSLHDALPIWQTHVLSEYITAQCFDYLPAYPPQAISGEKDSRAPNKKKTEDDQWQPLLDRLFTISDPGRN